MCHTFMMVALATVVLLLLTASSAFASSSVEFEYLDKPVRVFAADVLIASDEKSVTVNSLLGGSDDATKTTNVLVNVLLTSKSIGALIFGGKTTMWFGATTSTVASLVVQVQAGSISFHANVTVGPIAVDIVGYSHRASDGAGAPTEPSPSMEVAESDGSIIEGTLQRIMGRMTKHDPTGQPVMVHRLISSADTSTLLETSDEDEQQQIMDIPPGSYVRAQKYFARAATPNINKVVEGTGVPRIRILEVRDNVKRARSDDGLGVKNLVFVALASSVSGLGGKPPSAELTAYFQDRLQKYNAYYDINSYGQVSFTSKKRDGSFGFYGVATFDNNRCGQTDYSDISVMVAAAVAFTNDEDWVRSHATLVIVMITPDLKFCRYGVGGYGTVGGAGAGAIAWLYNDNYLYVHAHELGHTLGRYHAGTLGTEYGDCTSVMGACNQEGTQDNAPHKFDARWTAKPPSRQLVLQKEQNAKTFTIAPLNWRDNKGLTQVIGMGSTDVYTERPSAFPGSPSHFISFRRHDMTEGIVDEITSTSSPDAAVVGKGLVGVQVHRQLFSRSELLAVLSPGDTYEFQAREFFARVAFTQADAAGTATVTLTYLLKAATPPPGLPYLRLETPTRVVDTRLSGIIAGGTFKTFPTSYPDALIACSVQAVESQGDGFVTLWPASQPLPTASVLNFGKTFVASASAYFSTDASGSFSVYAHATTHVIIDFSGVFSSAGNSWFHPLPIPFRLKDSRISADPLAPRAPQRYSFAGVGAVPEDASAVSLTMGLVPVPPASPWVSVYKGDIDFPGTSIGLVNSPMVSGAAALVSLASDGTATVEANGPLHYTLDIDGYFSSNLEGAVGLVRLPNMVRILETRNSAGFYNNQGPLAPEVERSWRMTDISYQDAVIPANAVVLLATVTAMPIGRGFVTIWPTGQTRPTAAQLQYDPKVYASPLGLHLAVGAGGSISFYSNQACEIFVDVVGYYVAPTGVSRAEQPGVLASSSSQSNATAHLPAWAVALVVLAGLLVAAAMIALAALLYSRHRRAQQQKIDFFAMMAAVDA